MSAGTSWQRPDCLWLQTLRALAHFLTHTHTLGLVLAAFLPFLPFLPSSPTPLLAGWVIVYRPFTALSYLPEPMLLFHLIRAAACGDMTPGLASCDNVFCPHGNLTATGCSFHWLSRGKYIFRSGVLDVASVLTNLCWMSKIKKNRLVNRKQSGKSCYGGKKGKRWHITVVWTAKYKDTRTHTLLEEQMEF